MCPFVLPNEERSINEAPAITKRVIMYILDHSKGYKREKRNKFAYINFFQLKELKERQRQQLRQKAMKLGLEPE